MEKTTNLTLRGLDMAAQLYREGKYAQALAQLLSSPSSGIQGDIIETAYYAGLCYMRLKRNEDALSCLEQVVTSSPSLDRVRQCRLLLAVAYALTGRERLADLELRKLLETGYKTAPVYSALAYIAWEQEKTEDSIAYYESALKEDDSCLTAVNGMGYVLACADRDLPRAQSLCMKAVSMAPGSAACLDSLGWVYYKMGLLKDAKTCLKKALAKARDNSEIQSHYDAVLEKEKNALVDSRDSGGEGQG